MKSVKIIVLENSPIIREGIQALLTNIERVNTVTFVASLDELEGLIKYPFESIILINPSFILTNTNQFNQLKSKIEQTKWIGIIYSHFPVSILNKLDGEIDIYDSRKNFSSKLTKWIETDGNDNYNNKETLTDREIDVLKLLAEGFSNKEIADNLNISVNTVITHRKNISQKTGIKSVSGLTIYAVVQNLISLDDF
jgi:DNA-binding NarL/FixJ family response regulator